jgi:serine/threonine protein kinase
LTGHVPFEGTVDEVVSAHVHTALTPPALVAPDITELTSNALMRAMAKNPAERFESYDDFRMALEAARSQVIVGQVRQAGQSDSGKSWWRR